MAQRNQWEDVYALEIFGAGTTLANIVASNPVFDGTTTKGVKGVFGTASGMVYNLLPEGHPAFKAAVGTVRKDLATGKALDNVVAYTGVTRKAEPIVITVGGFNAHNLSAFFKLFFHSGVAVANGVTNTDLQIMTCSPYSNTVPTTYGNLVKFMQATGESDAVDECLQGCLVKRIMMKGEEGGIIDGEVEFVGATYKEISLAGGAGGPLEKSKPFDDKISLRFEDMTVKLAGQTVSIPRFELTLENNTVFHYYNEVAAKTINLGRIDGSGTIVIPWNDTTSEGKNKQIQDLIASVDKTLSFIWGNPTSGSVDVLPASAKNGIVANYLSIDMNVRLEDYTPTEIDGLPMLEVQFRIVEDAANTNGTITCKLGYNKNGNTW
jgi:hypothetical protein